MSNIVNFPKIVHCDGGNTLAVDGVVTEVNFRKSDEMNEDSELMRARTLADLMEQHDKTALEATHLLPPVISVDGEV